MAANNQLCLEGPQLCARPRAARLVCRTLSLDHDRRLTPSSTTFNGAITAGLAQYGDVDTRNMWGLPQLGRWKWHDPDVHVQLLVDK